MSASNWTGRAHRTLYSAFGPYTSAQIDDGSKPWHESPISLFIAAAAAVLACWAVVAALFIWSQQ